MTDRVATGIIGEHVDMTDIATVMTDRVATGIIGEHVMTDML